LREQTAMMRSLLTLAAMALAAVAACLPATAQQASQVEMLARPISVAPIERARWSRATPELAYMGVRAAHLADDAQWILASFAPADRNVIEGYLRDADMRAANARIHRGVVREEIVGRVSHRDYVILLVETHEASGLTYTRSIPMVSTPEGWAVTNALRDDPVFQALQVSARR
jgi:hypothetical protein